MPFGTACPVLFRCRRCWKVYCVSIMATYEACYSAGWSSRSVTQAAAFPLSLSLSLFSTSSCFSAKTLKMIVSPYGCILVVFCFFWKNWSCVPKCIPFPFYVSQTCLFECWKCYLVCFTLDCVYVFVVLQCVLLSCFSFYFFFFSLCGGGERSCVTLGQKGLCLRLCEQ